MPRFLALFLPCLWFGSVLAFAADSPAGAQPAVEREVPARRITVPRDISPELQAELAIPPSIPFPAPIPDAPEKWRELVHMIREMPERQQLEQAVLAQMPATITPSRIAGVPVYTVMPARIATQNRARLAVYLHGGGYVFGEGDSAAIEAVQLAHSLEMKVIAVDYRMPPDHPFPAAIDDVVAVWKSLLRSTAPERMALAGVSAGGGLTLSSLLRLAQLRLPMPGAVFAGSPWVDLTNAGDSFQTNEGIDNVLSNAQAWLPAMARLYAGKNDLREPLLSPVNGDFTRCPPTLLFSGTRDLLLSDTVRAHRRLRAAGVDAQLHVFEAMSHTTWGIAIASPESRDAYAEIAAFFDRHLQR